VTSRAPKTRRRSLSTACALIVAGCTSSSAPSLKQACSDFVTIVRHRETSCYGVAAEPNESTLISRQVESCVLASSAPGSQVGGSYWESCGSAANNGCAGYKCATYPAGTRNDGEPCLTSTQCASLWCRATSVVDGNGSVLRGAVQCGACASRLPEGASCDVATDACDVGLSCFGGACRTLGSQGAACATWSDCAAPAFVCKSSGTCGTITPTGAPCVTSSDCTTDTGCDLVTKVCTAAHFAQPGESCDGEVHRCKAGRCNTVAGVCPTILTDGTACDATDPSKVCDDYASCFQGICQIPDPATCK
jgi:hypothetical protein